MNEQEIKMVKNSWRHLRNIDARVFGDLFYSKLFMEAPQLKHLFTSPITEQYLKLVRMINMIVMHLENTEIFTEEISRLASRHLQYGVKATHYQLVGNSLLWTLEKGLGNDWSEEVGNAWTKCYNMIANIMVSTVTNNVEIIKD